MKLPMQYIDRVAKLPFKLWREITFDVYMLSYDTKKILYVVPASLGTTPYFIDKICNESAIITKIKRIYLWDLRKFAEQQDAVLIELYRPFARFLNGGLLVPPLVDQVLDIDKPLDDAIKISSKQLKKVHKYSYEISNDFDALKFFYENMYSPYLKRKYGDSAVDKFSNFEKIFRNGELMFITLNGERVSASLNEISNNIYYCRKNGVSDEKSIKEGTLVAAYYFSILRAKDIGIKIVDFGRSRPFLTDGVLKHKSRWGTRICDDKTVKRIIYLKNILFEQPFIYIEDEKLKAVVFPENEELIKEYVRSGLEFNLISRHQMMHLKAAISTTE